jgi:hypothetical protein
MTEMVLRLWPHFPLTPLEFLRWFVSDETRRNIDQAWAEEDLVRMFVVAELAYQTGDLVLKGLRDG